MQMKKILQSKLVMITAEHLMGTIVSCMRSLLVLCGTVRALSSALYPFPLMHNDQVMRDFLPFSTKINY